MPIVVNAMKATFVRNVRYMTFFAVLYPQISARTSPSMYANGNVIVPASKSERDPMLMIFTASTFDVM